MKKKEIITRLFYLLFNKKKSNYEEMTASEFRNNVISIISTSRSKQEIKNRIRELGYLYQVCIYYGTSPRNGSVKSFTGVPVTTTLFFHPGGNFAID